MEACGNRGPRPRQPSAGGAPTAGALRAPGTKARTTASIHPFDAAFRIGPLPTPWQRNVAMALASSPGHSWVLSWGHFAHAPEDGQRNNQCRSVRFLYWITDL